MMPNILTALGSASKLHPDPHQIILHARGHVLHLAHVTRNVTGVCWVRPHGGSVGVTE